MQSVVQTFCGIHGLLTVCFGQNNSKFLATNALCHVNIFTKILLEQLSQFLNNQIASMVTIGAIDIFEFVNIYYQCR